MSQRGKGYHVSVSVYILRGGRKEKIRTLYDLFNSKEK